jgi:hypothetical protein
VIKPEQILKDFQIAVKKWSPLHRAVEKDFEFCLGKQWEDEDVETLRRAGVKALTINKIRPIIKLLTGIERQSKSDFVAFPEGAEDGVVADIATALLKNVVKNSDAEQKTSLAFKRGVIGGLDYIEPYVDYSYDLINGCLKFRNVSCMQVFPDPDAEEYDFSDGKFLIKFSPNLSKDQLVELFPNYESKIEKLESGKVDIQELDNLIKHVQGVDYPSLSKASDRPDDLMEYGFDLIEYQYKSYVKKFYLVDKVAEIVQEIEDKKQGEAYVSEHPEAKLITKKVPEIRVACYVSGEVLVDEALWCYPRWKKYSLIPFLAEWLDMKDVDVDLAYQGVVRSLVDLQEEFNKRRTQELRHLNSSVNSGIMYPKGSLTAQEKQKVKKYGSSPGIDIEYDGAIGKPERIFPAPLSQAHAQLAEENAQDLKEASGVNPDLLANADNDQSGRAILLKQKQGLIMVQEILDNYAQTKKLIGRFALSQLGELYTVESAVKILGQSFFEKFQEFQKPKVDEMGQPVMNPQTMQLETELDQEIVNEVINKVLNDPNLGNYDVTIGEGAYSETVRMSNHMTLMDMASKGFPIPPEILVEESMLPQGTKQRIVASMEQAQMMAMQQAKQQPQGDDDVRGQGNGRNTRSNGS